MEQQKNKVRAEVKLPFILIHTPFGLRFFDRVAKWPGAKRYADLNTYFMPVITALAVFLIVGSLIVMVSNATARDSLRGVGITGNLLIPGINPYLPITYGWVALIITIVIHEAGHGIVARVHNIRVDSTGIVLFAVIPIGAFVNIEREELAKATLKQKSSVLTAGPLNNMILAAASLIALYFVITTLTPLPPDPNSPQFGVMVVSVNPGSLAESVGMTAGSIIQQVGGQQVKSLEDLGTLLRHPDNLGKSVDITWIDTDGKQVTRPVALPAAPEPNKGILGVGVTPLSPDSKVVLDHYRNQFGTNPFALIVPPTMQQGSVPYSDLMAPKYTSSVFGNYYNIVANLLFWLWFINFNVGIFNALPIGPLDGGQLYSAVIEKRVRSKILAKNASNLLTYIMTAVVVASLFLPYIFQ